MATIEISNVWKRFPLHSHRPHSLKEALVATFRRQPPPEPFWALRDVSFEIERGETFGIIGNNGSGKSTMLKLITGISRPSKGRVTVNGTVSALLELGAGFHPDFSGRENVFLNGAILGLGRKQLMEKFDSIVSFAELEPFIDNPVKTYSSGMYMRLAFSIAIHVDPDILVIDEVLAVGDAAFQQKCFDQIHRFKHSGKTIVFVSHSLAAVQDLCQRAAWIDKGNLRALGKTDSVLEFYSRQIAESIEQNKQQADVLVPDGQVQIRNLHALDAEGNRQSMLPSGSSVRFDFDLDTTIASRDLEIFARIVRADGICCYDQRVPVSEFAEYPERGSVSLVIPELRLNSGNYFLQLSVTPRDAERWLEDKFFNFTVESSHKGQGIAPLEAEWVQRATPAAEASSK